MFIKFLLAIVLVAAMSIPVAAGESHAFIKPTLPSAAVTEVVRHTEPVEPAARKPFDASFKIALAFNVAGVAAAQISSEKALNRCNTCYEANVLFRTRDGGVNYVTNAIISAVPIVLSIILEKKGHRKAARILLWVGGAVRFIDAAHNTKVK